MTLYRVYCLDAFAAHITGPPIDIEAPDDPEAVNRAKQFLKGKPIELWQGARCVERLFPLKGHWPGAELRSVAFGCSCMNDPQQYRRQAEKCLRLANGNVDEATEEALRALATEYEEKGRIAELEAGSNR
jgi:hypothetical protein